MPLRYNSFRLLLRLDFLGGGLTAVFGREVSSKLSDRVSRGGVSSLFGVEVRCALATRCLARYGVPWQDRIELRARLKNRMEYVTLVVPSVAEVFDVLEEFTSLFSYKQIVFTLTWIPTKHRTIALPEMLVAIKRLISTTSWKT